MYKAIKPGDRDFTFCPDGITVVSRAGLEISANCPSQYMAIIELCVKQKWLQPVAFMRDAEYTWERLQS